MTLNFSWWFKGSWASVWIVNGSTLMSEGTAKREFYLFALSDIYIDGFLLKCGMDFLSPAFLVVGREAGFDTRFDCEFGV